MRSRAIHAAGVSAPAHVLARGRPTSCKDDRVRQDDSRHDGSRQATYAGRPLYYYVGDRKPGQILCQNVTEFGGVWRVVRASGRLVG